MRRPRRFLIFNTTTLIVLHELEYVDLLEEIQRSCNISIIIPQSVINELLKGDTKLNIPNAMIVEVQRSEPAIDIPRSLGKGELHAIAIAYSLIQEQKLDRNVVFVVTDDKRARKTCEKLEIRVVGTLGIIELAKKCRVISKEKAIELLSKIPNTSLYIIPEKLNEVQLKIERQ